MAITKLFARVILHQPHFFIPKLMCNEPPNYRVLYLSEAASAGISRESCMVAGKAFEIPFVVNPVEKIHGWWLARGEIMGIKGLASKYSKLLNVPDISRSNDVGETSKIGRAHV